VPPGLGEIFFASKYCQAVRRQEAKENFLRELKEIFLKKKKYIIKRRIKV